MTVVMASRPPIGHTPVGHGDTPTARKESR